MKNWLYIYVTMLCLLTAACTDDALSVDEGSAIVTPDPVGQPVLFTSGSEQPSLTRAGVPYMARDGRFVCTMYYHAKSSDTDDSPFDISDVSVGGTMITSWLRVNNNMGNSVYRKTDFSEPEDAATDDYGFDKGATIFYWQNRLPHAFLALADYHQLKTNDGTATTQGKLKLYPNWDKDFSALPDPADEASEEQLAAYANTAADGRYANTYDLTRGGEWAVRDKVDGEGQPVVDADGKTVKELYQKEPYTLDKFNAQPDPILALTIMKPEGSTQEANRVRLYFKHQFSQIQVNVKSAEDNAILADQIEKVELLGVSTEGYVCCRLNANGTVGVGTKPLGHTVKNASDEDVLDEDIMLGSASAKTVNLEDYDDDYLEFNEWGTSFEMFDMAEGDEDGDGVADGTDAYTVGYLRSFNAIAFGHLMAIRVTWREGETAADPIVRHVSTYKVPEDNSKLPGMDGGDRPIVKLQELQSSMKYIYNLELRRGTLAVIRTTVIPWEQKDELVYDQKGTIQ